MKFLTLPSGTPFGKLLIVVVAILVLFSFLACVDFRSRSKVIRNKKGEIVNDENGKKIMSFNGKDPINVQAYISRLAFSVIYLILGVFILFHFWEHFFYLGERNDLLFDSRYPQSVNDWPRFVWCGGVSLIGFSFAALQSRFSTSLPYFPYIFYYPVPIFLITCLSYSVLSLNPATRGYVFYPLSIAICGTLGVSIDKYWDIATALLKK